MAVHRPVVQLVVLGGVEPLQLDDVGAAAGQGEADARGTVEGSVFQQRESREELLGCNQLKGED